MDSFSYRLIRLILDAQFNELTDNHDFRRFGPAKLEQDWKEWLRALFRRLGFYRRDYLCRRRMLRHLARWAEHFPALERLYSRLDVASRELLANVVAYRIMGESRIRLPLSCAAHHQEFDHVAALAESDYCLPTKVGGFQLMKHDLTSLGWNVHRFMPAGGPLTTYVLEQYAQPQHGIRVKDGDYVIDCGGCWGDTALYFAHLAGPTGRIFSFEFMQENLEVFHKNLDLNPSLKSRIEIIECPVWSRSGVEMSFSSSGPATQVKEAGSAKHSHVSLSIDDVVSQYSMPRVDFIKMDIEGAEFDALQGARQTIIQNRPDLALCVYHSAADFTRLADFVNELNLGYRFHLGHFTMHGEETVLFATARHN